MTSSAPRSESDLLMALASAPTIEEQRMIAAQLEEVRAASRAKAASLRVSVLDAPFITPVESRETLGQRTSASSASDWLADIEVPQVDRAEMENTMRAEATVWLDRRPVEVRQDGAEFRTQAASKARYLSNRYPGQREAAEAAFLDQIKVLAVEDYARPGDDDVTVQNAETHEPVEFEGEGEAKADPEAQTDASDSPSLAEGDQPEGDSPMTGGEHGPMSESEVTAASRKVAISLTNVGKTDDPLVFTGKDPSGKTVKFRVTQKESDDLKAVLYSDLAMNFSGVDVEESDLVKEGYRLASRKTAAQFSSFEELEKHVKALMAANPELVAAANAAYERQDQAWFDAQSTEDLKIMWEIAASSFFVGWDDEVYDALSARNFDFDSAFTTASRKTAAQWNQYGSATINGYHVTVHGTDGMWGYSIWPSFGGSGESDEPVASADWSTARPTERAARIEAERAAKALPAGSSTQAENDAAFNSFLTSASRKQASDGWTHLNADDSGAMWQFWEAPLSGGLAIKVQTQSSGVTYEVVNGAGYILSTGTAATKEQARADAEGKIASGVIYTASSRKVVAEGQTCEVCGDKIAKDPEGGGYHHDNGEKHDHEAKPKSEAKESSRRKTAAARPLYQIAAEIQADWGPNVNYAARPYLDAMAVLDTINDSYGMDDAKSIVLYFLSNARSWTGDKARAIKKELKAMADGRTASRKFAARKPVKAIHLTQHKKAREITVNGLEDMQAAVGGYIEPITLSDGSTMYCNEEYGYLPNSEVNWAACDIAGLGGRQEFMFRNPIKGPVLIVGPVDAEGYDTDVTDKARNWVQRVGREAGVTWASRRTAAKIKCQRTSCNNDATYRGHPGDASRGGTVYGPSETEMYYCSEHAPIGGVRSQEGFDESTKKASRKTAAEDFSWLSQGGGRNPFARSPRRAQAAVGDPCWSCGGKGYYRTRMEDQWGGYDEPDYMEVTCSTCGGSGVVNEPTDYPLADDPIFTDRYSSRKVAAAPSGRDDDLDPGQRRCAACRQVFDENELFQASDGAYLCRRDADIAEDDGWEILGSRRRKQADYTWLWDNPGPWHPTTETGGREFATPQDAYQDFLSRNLDIEEDADLLINGPDSDDYFWSGRNPGMLDGPGTNDILLAARRNNPSNYSSRRKVAEFGTPANVWAYVEGYEEQERANGTGRTLGNPYLDGTDAARAWKDGKSDALVSNPPKWTRADVEDDEDFGWFPGSDRDPSEMMTSLDYAGSRRKQAASWIYPVREIARTRQDADIDGLPVSVALADGIVNAVDNIMDSATAATFLGRPFSEAYDMAVKAFAGAVFSSGGRVYRALRQAFRRTATTQDVLDAIQAKDPDGFETREPQDADYESFERWVKATYGEQAWKDYQRGGWANNYGDNNQTYASRRVAYTPPIDASWQQRMDESLAQNPRDRTRWEDAIWTVHRGEDAASRADQYARHLGDDHPIVEYLRAHSSQRTARATPAELAPRIRVPERDKAVLSAFTALRSMASKVGGIDGKTIVRHLLTVGQMDESTRVQMKALLSGRASK